MDCLEDVSKFLTRGGQVAVSMKSVVKNILVRVSWVQRISFYPKDFYNFIVLYKSYLQPYLYKSLRITYSLLCLLSSWYTVVQIDTLSVTGVLNKGQECLHLWQEDSCQLKVCFFFRAALVETQ